MKIAITLFLQLAFIVGISAQNYFDNDYKSWDVGTERYNTSGADHIASASENSTKIFFSIGGGESIPNKLWDYQNITVLKISHAMNSSYPSVGEISEKLNGLTKLKYIYFYDIGIESLPSNIGALTELKSLVVKENTNSSIVLKQLPNFTKTLSIESINIDLNKKTTLSQSVNFNTIFENRNLKALLLSSSNLTNSDITNLCKLDSLELLELHHNLLTEAPNVESLKRLKILSLDNNSIESVGSSIGNLRDLKMLSMIDNKLRILPDEMGDLKNIRYLNLDDNMIAELPESLSSLDKLEVLSLSGNEMTEIPSVIYSLKNLKELHLMDTNIATIDERILNTKIEKLTICNKEVGQFNFDPKMLANMKSLKSFRTSNLRVDKDLIKSVKKLKKLRPDVSNF
ncbi:leucine-rich repeat domain-containing protein [Saccharicrinis aurantiacus]|uniref:leucine-rich repeat domain-containing protein n=1 Tax=Saccharicrinis aurantiacus TaxID=1849719 RepID=UPI0024917E23|nr:leucine-rich repeat domain-containing protein [Saccharicrinis aurantiacus]